MMYLLLDVIGSPVFGFLDSPVNSCDWFPVNGPSVNGFPVNGCH